MILKLKNGKEIDLASVKRIEPMGNYTVRGKKNFHTYVRYKNAKQVEPITETIEDILIAAHQQGVLVDLVRCLPSPGAH